MSLCGIYRVSLSLFLSQRSFQNLSSFCFNENGGGVGGKMAIYFFFLPLFLGVSFIHAILSTFSMLVKNLIFEPTP